MSPELCQSSEDLRTNGNEAEYELMPSHMLPVLVKVSRG